MHYIRFINKYKQNSLAKKKYYDIVFNKKTNTLLTKFIELGLIKQAFHPNKLKRIIRIYINYIKGEKVYVNIINHYCLSKKKNINLKTLNIKKTLSKNTTFLLFTSLGIITNFEACKIRSGGLLFCQINY